MEDAQGPQYLRQEACTDSAVTWSTPLADTVIETVYSFLFHKQHIGGRCARQLFKDTGFQGYEPDHIQWPKRVGHVYSLVTLVSRSPK
jgi:hypothetical protein